MDKTPYHSRNQTRIQNFIDASRKLEPFVRDERSDLLAEVLHGMTDAVILFGRSEMDYRQAQRYRALDIKSEEAQRREERGGFHHERGLQSLEAAIESIREFEQEASEYEPVEISSDDEDIQYLRREWRAQLAELEIKASDVKRLNDALEEALGAVIEGQAEGIARFVEQRLTELQEIRESETRGTEENIPVWKIAAVAAFFGIAMWALMKCRWRWFGRKCTWKEELIYALIAKAAAAGYNLC